MNFETIDNFLTKSEFQQITKNTIYNENFSLYMKSGTSYVKKDGDYFASDGVYFNHCFFIDDEINSEAYSLLTPFLDKIDIKKILRIQLNLYPKTFFIKKHGWHIDFNFPHKGCILYLNINNGKTILKNKVFNTSIDSVANRVLFFEPHLKHRSTTCTDREFRSNIIINYL